MRRGRASFGSWPEDDRTRCGTRAAAGSVPRSPRGGGVPCALMALDMAWPVRASAAEVESRSIGKQSVTRIDRHEGTTDRDVPRLIEPVALSGRAADGQQSLAATEAAFALVEHKEHHFAITREAF
jgi:hypothetical protein